MTRVAEKFSISRLCAGGYLPPRRCQGLTLVELMISLVLSLLLSAAIVQLFIGNKQTFRMQEATARLQENGRFAMEFITRDMRVAGYSGCVLDAENVTNTLNDRDTSFLWGFSRAVQGFDGGSTNWSPNWTGSAYADFDFDDNPGPAAIAGTDIITLHAIEGLELKGTQEGNLLSSNPGEADIEGASDAGIQAGDIIFVTDCDKAAITQVTGINGNKLQHDDGTSDTPGNSTDTLSHVYADAEVFKARAVSYFIALGSGGRPSLWRRIDPGITEEVVEGVEDMQILYGLADDVNKWGTVSRYLTAAELETANAATAEDLWRQVAAVRFRLLVQSDDNVAEQAQTYRYDGAAITAGDARVRREFVTTVGVRNRIL